MASRSLDQFKRYFFDRDAVQRAVDRMAVRRLSMYGAFVRRRARSSIRKRKKASKPGQPPSSHVGLLKDFLFFAYDPATKSVVIGPALLNQKLRGDATRPASGTVPEALEYGADLLVTELQLSGGGWKRSDLLPRGDRKGRNKRVRTASLAERPYMRPAGEAERSNPKLIELFKDQLRAA